MTGTGNVSKDNNNNKSVDFSLSPSDVKKDSLKNSKKLNKRSSSFFRNLSGSFRRSGGERGADVDTLRGTHGPNFEGYALVVRGPSTEIDCGCFGGSKRRKEQLLLIKGPFIFVFDSEKDKAPKYAINLVHLSARYNGTFGGDHVVLLETSLRDVEYEFNFEKKEIAKSFIEAVTEQAQNGETNEIIKHLGHEKLLLKRSSVSFAEKVALKKVDDQPEKPVGLTEMGAMTGTLGTVPL